MTIAEEFLEILREIRTKKPFPMIKEIFIPKYSVASPKKASFGLIQLEGGAAGIIYLSLSPTFLEQAVDLDVMAFIGKDPFEIAQWLVDPKSSDLQKGLALGTINAMSSNFFEQSGFPLDFATNSMGNLSLIETDHVGMVGYFPPLVKQIGERQILLTVIEKKKALVQSHPNWEVTLNPASLKKCNKVIITSTTILNNTLDDILKYCAGAEFISVIGPTAGFIPDPLFKRGVHILGGTKIHDPVQLRHNFEKGHRWGSSTRKYCIDKAQYAGYRAWLAKL
ncbi:MAG: Rossmann-like domain-containing protein [Promethearchaeota archaeon]